MFQFEKHADKYEKVRNKITYPEDLYKKLASICNSHQSALDIGCGNGVSTIRLKPYFKDVIGVDIGEKLIQFAKQSYPDIKFLVSSAEKLDTDKKYDLVTSATSFYWMDRPLVLKKMASLLSDQGVFCAYKYDFPIVYGELRNFITYELATKWAKHRDKRLINYDDTLELINYSGVFNYSERFIISNIIELTSEEIALFFLSTSYVTKYIEETKDLAYPEWFITECKRIDNSNRVKINFDVYGNLGRK